MALGCTNFVAPAVQDQRQRVVNARIDVSGGERVGETPGQDALLGRRGPGGQPVAGLTAVAAHRRSGPFVQILTGSRLLAAFGDDQTALVMYDTETVPVKSAPGAECVTVTDGKITHSRFVFDRAPFDAARQAAR
jgi:hypothetical protein